MIQAIKAIKVIKAIEAFKIITIIEAFQGIKAILTVHSTAWSSKGPALIKARHCSTPSMVLTLLHGFSEKVQDSRIVHPGTKPAFAVAPCLAP